MKKFVAVAFALVLAACSSQEEEKKQMQHQQASQESMELTDENWEKYVQERRAARKAEADREAGTTKASGTEPKE